MWKKIMTHEMERMWKKDVAAYLRYYLSTFLRA
jgi:hypothetical protein